MARNIFQQVFNRQVIASPLFLAFVSVGVLIGALFPIILQSAFGISIPNQGIFYTATIAAGIALAVINMLIVHFLLLRKLVPVSQMSARLADGDLHARCVVTGNDLVGGIGSNMNDMADHLQAVIDEIGSAIQQVEDAAVRLKNVSDETDSCLQRQQMETEQVAAAMNQMTSTFQEVANNAEQAAGSSKDASQQASNGALVATEAIGGLDSLIGRIQNAANVVDGLRTDSDNIGVVLEVIRGIAEQTNLLALNAAIEAARAGEQGRGFAVVADEVRTLASRTQKSTEEIQTMIETLQNNAVSAVDVMNSVKSQAETASEQVENGAEALAEIAGAVSVLDSMNTQVANAVEQQRAVAEDINRSVHTISESTEQTAAGTQQTASSSEQLNGLVTRLRAAVGQFH